MAFHCARFIIHIHYKYHTFIKLVKFYVKGFYVNELGQVNLISNMIKDLLNIECCVVMGANIASDVASENFCEATIGKNITKYNINLKSYIISFPLKDLEI